MTGEVSAGARGPRVVAAESVSLPAQSHFQGDRKGRGDGEKTQGEEGQVTGGDTGVWGRSERLWPVWGEMEGG